MTEKDSFQGQHSIEINEYHKMEIQEIFSRTRQFLSLRVQVASFFGTINLALLSIAFNSQKISLIFIATGTMLLLIVVDGLVIKRGINAAFFRGLELEKKYAPDGEMGYLHTHIAVAMGRRNTLSNSPGSAQHQDRQAFLKTLRAFRPGLAGFWLPLVAIFAEVVLGIVLWVSGWSLF